MIVERDWGTYETIHENARFKVKILRIKPNYRHTEQRHLHRTEVWFWRDKDTGLPQTKFIDYNEWHRIENRTDEWMEIIEIQKSWDDVGNVEEDIERRP